MPERLHMSAEQILDITDRYKRGETLLKLADDINASTTPILAVLIDFGIQRRPPGRKPIELPDFDEYQKKFDAGTMSVAQIWRTYLKLGLVHNKEFYRRNLQKNKITRGGKKINP